MTLPKSLDYVSGGSKTPPRQRPLEMHVDVRSGVVEFGTIRICNAGRVCGRAPPLGCTAGRKN